MNQTLGVDKDWEAARLKLLKNITEWLRKLLAKGRRQGYSGIFSGRGGRELVPWAQEFERAQYARECERTMPGVGAGKGTRPGARATETQAARITNYADLKVYPLMIQFIRRSLVDAEKARTVSEGSGSLAWPRWFALQAVAAAGFTASEGLGSSQWVALLAEAGNRRNSSRSTHQTVLGKKRSAPLNVSTDTRDDDNKRQRRSF